MKKNFIPSIISLCALLLTVVGCESQKTIEVPSDDYVTGTLNVTQNYEITTKIPTDMQLRYVIEIWANDDSESTYFKTLYSFDEKVELSLVKGYYYEMAIWGDYVPSTNENAATEGYYSTESLKEITANTSSDAIDASSEAKDAFFAPLTIEDPIDGSFAYDVTLSRAVANLALINSSEISADATESVSIAYTLAYDNFNAFTGEVTSSSINATTVSYKVTSGDTAVANDYFFAPDTEDGCSVTFKVGEGSENTVIIKRNYKTNVTGSFIQ